MLYFLLRSAGVAELVDAADLKSAGHICPCGFEPRPRYQSLTGSYAIERGSLFFLTTDQGEDRLGPGVRSLHTE